MGRLLLEDDFTIICYPLKTLKLLWQRGLGGFAAENKSVPFIGVVVFAYLFNKKRNILKNLLNSEGV
jgi:hypothetical protein